METFTVDLHVVEVNVRALERLNPFVYDVPMALPAKPHVEVGRFPAVLQVSEFPMRELHRGKTQVGPVL